MCGKKHHETCIAWYAKLGKRWTQNTVIGELKDRDGTIYSDKDNLLRITTNFYKDLYRASSVNLTNQNTLLQKVDKGNNKDQQLMLGAEFTEKERVVNQLEKVRVLSLIFVFNPQEILRLYQSVVPNFSFFCKKMPQ